MAPQPTHLLLLTGFLALAHPAALEAGLTIRENAEAGTISVHREGIAKPLVVQNARTDFRPFLHPIRPADGVGELTQFSPGHHRHQTGLYWGFTRLNGRDYFHHPDGDYWKRVSAEVLQGEGEQVRWRTVYDLLAADGTTVLTETQTWSMEIDHEQQVTLDLEWNGKAGGKDVTISKYNYGGLFLRMPWKRGIHAHVLTAARDRDQAAEGKRSMWLDVGMQIDGREDEGHITIFDHPKNDGFPNAWRVDGQFGVGPCRARQGDWTITAGKDKTFRHRFLVFTGEANDRKITGQWTAWSGQKYTHALWGIAQREGREAKFLEPDEAVAAMTVAEGFEVNAFAAEPMITQPMAFCWDARGRMWIAENRDYESRGGGFSNSGDSRILILEDTDRDGVADKRTVFLEGIPFPAAVAVGFDGLWLGAPPNLLFIPDRNHDDKADLEDIEVRLTGWGIRDRHETLNSFHWGPDGWLYGCQGYATPSKVGKPKGRGRIYQPREPFPKKIELEGPGVDINGGVWRYHPTKDRFEVVAHGFSNPWGIDYDANGQFFITACVIPHLWHVIPGGIYHRQGGRHFNPHVYSDIRTIADHRHRSAHGGARIYLSDALPERYHGQIFMANIHEHAVLVDRLEPSGSGFIGRHGEDFLRANNAQWIGFSMEIGPAGDLYVLDWHDADICGKTVANKETGRVFRIAPKDSQAGSWEGRFDDLNRFEDGKLVDLQRSPSAWHARQARLILQARAASGALAKDTRSRLTTLLESSEDPHWRLRALWALHVTGGIEEARLLGLLSSKQPYLRGWAIQLLCEDGTPSQSALDRFASLARKDDSPVVRLYLAAALQRLEPEARWSIAEGLVSHGADRDDHNIPKMLWFALEPLVAKHPARALALAAGGRIPILQNYTARRAAQAEALPAVLTALAAAPSAVRWNMLNGTLDGLGGGNKIPAPENWAGLHPKLQGDPDARVGQVAQRLAQRFGDSTAVTAMLQVIADESAPPSRRREAIRALAAQQHPELAPRLEGLLDDEALRLAAIRATAAYELEPLADALLARYDTLDEAGKTATVQALASRPKYGWKLALAIKSGRVPRADVPAYLARQLRRVVGSGFVEIWGPIDELSADKAKAFEKYRTLLSAEAVAGSDPARGRLVYQKTCAACHQMYGIGGDLGPDITGSNRGDLAYLLDNLLDPSGEIPEGYQLVIVNTRDGRVHSGTVASETDRELVLRVVGDRPVTIPKSEIQSRDSPKVSLMPEGLLATLPDAEVLDLVAYLRTAKQVELTGDLKKQYETLPAPWSEGKKP